MFYCTHCGTKLGLDAKFCQNCGKPQFPNSEQLVDTGTTKLGGSKLAAITEFIMLLLVALFAFVMLIAVVIDAKSPGKSQQTIYAVLPWLISFTYLFNKLPWDKIPWKRSDFVCKHGIISGLFIAWLIAQAVYAVTIWLGR